jgi:uncharacterized membrane-anchored protein YitT (DUF2179 family)
VPTDTPAPRPCAPPSGAAPALARAHRPLDDLQALVTGTLFVALGLVLFQKAGLVTGGTAGLALLAHYALGYELALCMVVINLPFYVFAAWRMGMAFTLKTVAAVMLLSAFTWLLPRGLSVAHVAAPVAAVLGGLLCGAGMLMLFRHRASLGGLNTVVLYLQERFGWRAGHVQMAMDAVLILAGLLVADAVLVAWSVLGAAALNAVLAINHLPGRYWAGQPRRPGTIEN